MGRGRPPRPGQEGLIHVSEVLFENMVEVPHGLVGVKPEGEIDWVVHGVAHGAGVKPRGSRRAGEAPGRVRPASCSIRKNAVWASKGMASPMRM